MHLPKDLNHSDVLTKIPKNRPVPVSTHLDGILLLTGARQHPVANLDLFRRIRSQRTSSLSRDAKDKGGGATFTIPFRTFSS